MADWAVKQAPVIGRMLPAVARCFRAIAQHPGQGQHRARSNLFTLRLLLEVVAK